MCCRTWEQRSCTGSQFFTGTTELEFTEWSDNDSNPDWKWQGPKPKQGAVTRQGMEQSSGILKKELARPMDKREWRSSLTFMPLCLCLQITYAYYIPWKKTVVTETLSMNYYKHNEKVPLPMSNRFSVGFSIGNTEHLPFEMAWCRLLYP